MPISLAALLKKTRTISGTLGEDSWSIQYYPHKMDDAAYALFRQFRQEEGFASLNTLLVDLIASWDLYISVTDGTLLPITIDSMEALPSLFKINVMKELLEDADPDPKSSNESLSNGSSRVEVSESAPTSIRQSLRQNGQD